MTTLAAANNCKKCGGLGYVPAVYGNTSTCPECRGTGRTVDWLRSDLSGLDSSQVAEKLRREAGK